MSPLAALTSLDDTLSFLTRESDEGCQGGCLAGWKVGFAVILLVEGLLFGHTVFLLKRATTGVAAFHSAVSVGHALSAGVFFATGLLHVLPEAVELFGGGEAHAEEEEEEEVGHEEHGVKFPWPYLAVMLSFYLLFFVEKIAMPRVARRYAADADGNSEGEGLNEEKTTAAGDEVAVGDEGMALAGFRSRAFALGFVEIMGLSAHSLFESMALGLSGEFATVLSVFLATLGHRWSTAVAIGFKLARGGLRYGPFVTLLVLFSIMVPLGVALGAALSGLSETVQGVLFAVSAGTFLYVGAYETLAEEFGEGAKWKGRKFVAVVIGSAIVVAVTILLVAFDVHG